MKTHYGSMKEYIEAKLYWYNDVYKSRLDVLNDFLFYSPKKNFENGKIPVFKIFANMYQPHPDDIVDEISTIREHITKEYENYYHRNRGIIFKSKTKIYSSCEEYLNDIRKKIEKRTLKALNYKSSYYKIPSELYFSLQKPENLLCFKGICSYTDLDEQIDYFIRTIRYYDVKDIRNPDDVIDNAMGWTFDWKKNVEMLSQLKNGLSESPR